MLRDDRNALQTVREAKKDSDEFYMSVLAGSIAAPIKESLLEDAKHFANPKEALVELLIEQVMRTIWEGFGELDFHPVHTK